MTLDEVHALTEADEESMAASAGREATGPRFPKFTAAMATARRRGHLPDFVRSAEGEASSMLPAEASGDKDRRTLLFSLGLLGIAAVALPAVTLVHFLAASPAAAPSSAGTSAPPPAATPEVEPPNRAEAGPWLPMPRESEPWQPHMRGGTTFTVASTAHEEVAPEPSSSEPAVPEPVEAASSSDQRAEAELPSTAVNAVAEPTKAVVNKSEITRRPSMDGDTEASTAKAARGGDYRIQLAAMSAEAAARRMWNDLMAEHGAVLGAMAPAIERSGALHLLGTGPFATLEQAQSACDHLRQDGTECIIAAW